MLAPSLPDACHYRRSRLSAYVAPMSVGLSASQSSMRLHLANPRLGRYVSPRNTCATNQRRSLSESFPPTFQYFCQLHSH